MTKDIKMVSVNKIRDFTLENYYKQIGFSKESSYYSIKCFKKINYCSLTNKLAAKVPDCCNVEEHC